MERALPVEVFDQAEFLLSLHHQLLIDRLNPLNTISLCDITWMAYDIPIYLYFNHRTRNLAAPEDLEPIHHMIGHYHLPSLQEMDPVGFAILKGVSPDSYVKKYGIKLIITAEKLPIPLAGKRSQKANMPNRRNRL